MRSDMVKNMAVGAMAPHALDDVFAEGMTSAKQRLLESDLFSSAFDAAEHAYQVAKANIEKNPGICGASPEQQARNAFLDKLNNV